jgi:uncharacterized protein YjcR
MAQMRAKRADMELEMLRLNQHRNCFDKLFLDEKLAPREIAERLGTKHTTLLSWMKLNGIQPRDAKQAQQARLERQRRAEMGMLPSALSRRGTETGPASSSSNWGFQSSAQVGGDKARRTG